jgi:hypothetical protein
MPGGFKMRKTQNQPDEEVKRTAPFTPVEVPVMHAGE